MAVKTVKRVPLIKVGTWGASTGETSITVDTLNNIMSAHESGKLNLAVIKIGHTDPRMENPTWDGEPAYGQVDNLEIDDADGGTVYGDYINVPEELADKLESAYPYRSVEIFWDVELKDADGAVTDTFPAVLTGLALLGQSAPAVTGLDTIHSGFRATTKGKRTVFTASDFAFKGDHTANTMRRELQKAVDASLPDGWGWVVDHDDTHVWFESGNDVFQRSYSVAEDGAISVSNDQVRVIERHRFAPVSDTGTVPQLLASSGEAVNVGGAVSAVEIKDTGEGEPMAEISAAGLEGLRKLLGLPEGASVEEISAAAEVGKAVEPVVDTPVVADAPVVAATETPAATELSGSVVQVSASAFASMQSDFAALLEKDKARTLKEDKERQENTILSAIRGGKIRAEEADTWRNAIKESEATTVTLLSNMKQVIPTSEIGHANFAEAHPNSVTETVAAADMAFFGLNTESK